ncbi:unnamed protein product [Mytilus coruscus]|uniref:Reverse transcriptase zinc-binding domain-containing protein n=1 Tax=Mytilus coruscus TaxID=42192 RepID=A0A6J8DE78_MYTCO|nr:unnamed protein product [Mytilus coruscus]
MKWKTTVKHAIGKFWETKWNSEKTEKSTIKFLDIKHSPFGKPHQICKNVSNTVLDVTKAEVKAKLVTRTYTLQHDKSKFSGHKESDLCTLCGLCKEDTKHFLLECTALKDIRDKHLLKIEQYIRNNYSDSESIIDRLEKEDVFLQFILDSSLAKLHHIAKLKCHNIRELECLTRFFCNGLHTKRSALLLRKK